MTSYEHPHLNLRNIISGIPIPIETPLFRGWLLVSFDKQNRVARQHTVIACYGQVKEAIRLNDLKAGTFLNFPLKVQPSRVKVSIINFIATTLNFRTFHLHQSGNRPYMHVSVSEAARTIWVRNRPFLNGPDLTRDTVRQMMTDSTDHMSILCSDTRHSQVVRRTLKTRQSQKRRSMMSSDKHDIWIKERQYLYFSLLGNEFDFSTLTFDVSIPLKTYKMNPREVINDRDVIHYGTRHVGECKSEDNKNYEKGDRWLWSFSIDN